MIKIKVLLENCSINKNYKSKHGLSILIENNDQNILLDVGSNNIFLKNAINNNINLKNVEQLFLSHNHIDHVGGINDFINFNNNCSIYLMDNIKNKYYIKILFLYIPISIKINEKYQSKITQLNEDMELNKNVYFLKNVVSKYRKPTFNKNLFKKINKKLVNDTFEHEGILVIEDNNELLIFNSCSHNGILNTIETVKEKLPKKNIRAYIGGLHLFDPPTKANESIEYLDYLINEIKKMDINIYTGHCTGKYALSYMKKGLGDKIIEINTGMELSI